MLRCEKKCCSITTSIPLRVCQGITTYNKSQEITVGDKEMWEKIMLFIGAACQGIGGQTRDRASFIFSCKGAH